MWISQWEDEDGFSEREPGGRTLTGAALCGRIACSERINLIGGRGWGWRCQAYFWECTDLITIEFAVFDKGETGVKELAK